MHNTIRYRALSFILLELIFANLYSQKVENVHSDISDNKICIHYDLLGIATGQSALVTVFMSTDGGESYGDPLRSVSGDVGLVTGPGKDRTIIWDVFNDLTELMSVNVKFKVKADLIGSEKVDQLMIKKIKLNLNANLGYKDKIDYSSVGINAKGTVYFNQLGVGLRVDYFKTFRPEIDYSESGTVYADTGHYWGYSAGVLIEYDFIRNVKYSLYPFLNIGQSKFLYTYNPEYRKEEYFEYSIFGCFGMGFDMRIYKFLYFGLELEYMLSPWMDLMPSENPDKALDGFNAGFVLKFVIDRK